MEDLRSLNKNDVVVRVCAIQISRSVITERINDTWLLTDKGSLSKTFLTVLRQLGWRYKLVIEKSAKDRQPNETHVECFKQIENNQSDIMLPAAVTEFKRVAFGRIPVLFDDVPFFVRAPGQVSEFAALIKPFSIEVWITIGITLIIGAFVFYGILRASPLDNSARKSNISNIFWDLVSSLCGKGIPSFDYVTGSAAIFAIVWGLGTFILTNAYSGAVVSCITFPGLTKVPESYSQLLRYLEADLYDASLPKESPLVRYIQESKQSVLRRLDEMFKKGRIIELIPSEGMTRVAKGDHALISYRILGKMSLAPDTGVTILESEEALFTSITGILTRRGFPFFKQLSSQTQRCFEAGIVNKIISDSIRSWKQATVKSRESVWRPLTLKQLTGPFAILIFGYILAAVSLLAENIASNLRKFRKNSNNKREDH